MSDGEMDKKKTVDDFTRIASGLMGDVRDLVNWGFETGILFIFENSKLKLAYGNTEIEGEIEAG